MRNQFCSLLLIAAMLMLAACSGKQKPVADGHASIEPWMGSIEDTRKMPQDLMVYAKIAGASKHILDAGEQARQDQRFNRIFFGPWNMGRPSVKKRDISAILGKARGYRRGSEKWDQGDWSAIAANAGLETFPSLNLPAITVRNADLREMPTHETRFSRPNPQPKTYPFDLFQYSLLPVGTPLRVAHASRDGRWYLVECPIAAGWVDSHDVAIVDDAFMANWQRGKYVALLQDKVSLPGGKAGIGTVLPYVGKESGRIRVLLPELRPDGMAGSIEVSLSSKDAAIKPLPMTYGNVARVGNVMMGQPYGWGGMYGERDCSALTRDIMTPFGIWLPRNSSPQARSGITQPLTGLDARDKEALIIERGTPFLSLIGLKGHITLYIGKYKGRAAIFHNTWGVRTVDGDNENSRHVIGRAVVTSITPGMELKNLYRPVTFVDRLHTMATPADPIQ